MPGLAYHATNSFDLTAAGNSPVLFTIPPGSYGPTPVVVVGYEMTGHSFVYTNRYYWQIRIPISSFSWTKISAVATYPPNADSDLTSSIAPVPPNNLGPGSLPTLPATAKLIATCNNEFPGSGTSVIGRLIWLDYYRNVLRTDNTPTLAPGTTYTLTVTPPVSSVFVNVHSLSQSDGSQTNSVSYELDLTGTQTGYQVIYCYDPLLFGSAGYVHATLGLPWLLDPAIHDPNLDGGATVLFYTPSGGDAGVYANHLWGTAAITVVSLANALSTQNSFGYPDLTNPIWGMYGEDGSWGFSKGTNDDVPVAVARISLGDPSVIDPQMSYGVGVYAGTTPGLIPPKLGTYVRSDMIAKIKSQSLWNGSSNNATPSGWFSTGYPDSGWTQPVGSPSPLGTLVGASGTDIWSQNPVAATGERAMFRHHFTVPDSTTGAVLGSYDTGVTTGAPPNTLSGYMIPAFSYVQGPSGSNELNMTLQVFSSPGLHNVWTWGLYASPTNSSMAGGYYVAQGSDATMGPVTTARHVIPPGENSWYYSFITTNLDPFTFVATIEVSVAWSLTHPERVTSDMFNFVIGYPTGGTIVEAYLNGALILTNATSSGTYMSLVSAYPGGAISLNSGDNVLAFLVEATYGVDQKQWLNYAWGIWEGVTSDEVPDFSGNPNWQNIDFIKAVYPAAVTQWPVGLAVGVGFVATAFWTRDMADPLHVSYDIVNVPKFSGSATLITIADSYYNPLPPPVRISLGLPQVIG